MPNAMSTMVSPAANGKRRKILQMCMLEPKLTMLDEIDSGLDVDAVRIVSETVSKYHNENNSILVITTTVKFTALET